LQGFLKGREKWRLSLPPTELARQDSAKKQRQKRSLEVIKRWPRGHLRVRLVQVEARPKGLSERTLAMVHRRVQCIFARQRTQATGHSVSAFGANDVSAWRGQVIIGCRGASNRPPSGCVRCVFSLFGTLLEFTGRWIYCVPCK
jgi:hypothetical protein